MKNISSSALRGFCLNLTLAFAMFVLSLFLADHALWMLGLPAPAHVNPPHLEEVRKNIEFQYEFRTNSLGFRYKEIPFKKPKDTFRIYLAGDSFTEGMGLAEDETWGAILERRYSRAGREINFINGGLAGTGPEQYGDIFLKVGTKYHPDGLLICLYANDVADTWKPPVLRRNPLKRWLFRFFPSLSEAWSSFKERLTHKPPLLTEASRDMIADTTAEALRRGYDPKRIEEWKSRLPVDLVAASDRGEFAGGILTTGLLYPLRFTDSLDIDTPAAESKWRSMTDILSHVVSECRRRRIEAAFAFFPLEFQYVPEYHRPDNPWIVAGAKTRREWLSGETELQRRCRAWAKENGLPFLDLTPALRKSVSEGRRLNYPMDGHWNAEGGRIVAAILGDWIGRGGVYSFIAPDR